MNGSRIMLAHLYHRPPGGGMPGAMIAASPGIEQAFWEECRRLAPLIPPQRAAGALGLFQGETAEFILAHAYQSGGQGLVHYVPLTAEQLRQFAGRPTLLFDLMAAAITPAAGTGGTIPPLAWQLPAPPSAREHESDLSAFMLMVSDNFAVIEGLLAALVSGRPVAIVNGPDDLAARLTLLQGLLALLPVPARYGVTFATDADGLDATPVQIAYRTADTVPPEAVVYDWQAGRLTGPKLPEEPYSHFITRQLRLDPSIAVNQLQTLAQTATWRFQRGETLAQALGWAARRASLDAAVTEGQPADTEQVAAILREDPTLSDDLRVRYVRHLLAFMLALEDFRHADVVGQLMQAHEDVATAVLNLLDTATLEGKTGAVYRLVRHWVTMPGGPTGSNVRRRGHTAASAYLGTLVKTGAGAAAAAFLDDLQAVSEPMMLTGIMPGLLESTLPLAEQSPELAMRVLTLAAEQLPAASFRTLLTREGFVRQLPAPLRTALVHFRSGPPTAAGAGELVQAVAGLPRPYDLLLLGRLVEWALAMDRPDLIDTPVLERLAQVARSPLRGRLEPVLREAALQVGQPATLTALQEPGPRLLVEILLTLGEYRPVVALMERISTTLFRGDAQVHYATWVSEVFEKSALGETALVEALQAITRHGLKPVPTVMAYRGVLASKGFTPTMEPVMARLMEYLCTDQQMVKLVGFEVALRLMQEYARRRDEEGAVCLAAAITNNLEGVEEGLAIMGRIWSALNWNHEVHEAALELMRRYVRQVSPERAARIPEMVRRRLGDWVADALRATGVMNIVTGGADLTALAHELRITTTLLKDIAVAYEQKPFPTISRLRSDLDAMSGSGNERVLAQLAADLLTIGRMVYELGNQAGRGRGRDREHEKLLANQEAPRTGVGALIWISGYLSGGRAYETRLTREAAAHLVGQRSINMLMEEAATARRLLERLRQAFPANPPRLTLPAFRAEIESLWHGLRLDEQQRLQEPLAADLQTLASLILLMTERGDPKALTDSGLGRSLETGRREPRSALEALRLLYGYFSHRF